MPHHCCVPKCTSNSDTSPDLAWHGFPSDPVQKKVWLVKIRRDEKKDVPKDHPEYFEVTGSTKICSAHFKSEDYHPGDRRRTEKTTDICRRNLNRKANVFPSVFTWTAESKASRKEPAQRHDLQPPAKRKKHAPEKVASWDPPPGSGAAVESNPDNLDAENPTTSTTATSTCVQHCPCVKELQTALDMAMAQNEELQTKCAILEHDAASQKASDSADSMPRFTFGLIKGSNHLVSYYTGFSSVLMLMACFNYLQPSAENMRLWKGADSTADTHPQQGAKPGSKPKLSLLDQFLLVLMRLRLSLGEVDLAFRFQVSQSTVSRLTVTWVNLMYHQFKELPIWLSRRAIDKLMPPCFKTWYPSTRVIIDCTEFYINTPSLLSRQSATWSSYKNHNTVKALIGIAPHGHVTFVSDVYEGSISDKAITEVSGLLQQLEVGDSVMADKGFEIRDMLAAVGVRLNIPPFKSGDRQMTPEALMATKKIAAVRIHVERKMQRIKAYKIIAGDIDTTLFDQLNAIVFVCAMLTNFEGALVA